MDQTEEERPVEVTEQGVQDIFLNQVRRDHHTVTVYLLRGIKLTGKIKGFDKFSILFDAGGSEMLIFKHAISTISVPKGAEGKIKTEIAPSVPGND